MGVQIEITAPPILGSEVAMRTVHASPPASTLPTAVPPVACENRCTMSAET